MVLAALRECFGSAGVPRVLWVLLVALRGRHSPCRGAAGCVACCSKHCYAASGNPQTCSLRNDSSQKFFSRKRFLVDIWFLDLCSLLVPHDLSRTRMCMWSFLFKASSNKVYFQNAIQSYGNFCHCPPAPPVQWPHKGTRINGVVGGMLFDRLL